MKKTFILLFYIAFCFVVSYAQNVNTYRLDAVTDAYTTPDGGELLIKRKDNLPRMADSHTKFILRFDPFYFSAENEGITSADVSKAEVVIVSVLEGGLTGTSRRVDDASILVYKCDNSWEVNNHEPEPFEIGDPIAGPIYFPGIGANDGTEDFMSVYETPTRIDITDFFKTQMDEGNEFSIDFIKSSDYSVEYTRMGGVGQSDEAKRPRIEITYSLGTGVKNQTINSVKTWSVDNTIHTKIGNNYSGSVEYTLLSATGQTIEKQKIGQITDGEITSKANLPKGLYIVKLQVAGNTITQKVLNK
ncbi:MAG: T9SS type A sorting domain-containing protein [Paludibacter sp.]|nr:T9SS type A sorting domain-containing protein [Paludibacter sp.]